jgi:hypothetical protein
LARGDSEGINELVFENSSEGLLAIEEQGAFSWKRLQALSTSIQDLMSRYLNEDHGSKLTFLLEITATTHRARSCHCKECSRYHRFTKLLKLRGWSRYKKFFIVEATVVEASVELICSQKEGGSVAEVEGYRDRLSGSILLAMKRLLRRKSVGRRCTPRTRSGRILVHRGVVVRPRAQTILS